MAFADLKNDFVFRRIFANRPEILRSLLNDLLDRRGERAVEAVEYLPSEQFPLVEGAKFSILDVRCRDRAGTTFVVEMQLLHSPGFVNRVVYNACRAYGGQLRAGEPYTQLADVVAISICDFVIWPDAAQDAAGLPRVPMLSRWNMTERASGNHGLLQVQYAFLELPKLPPRPPEPGAELWAWLFVHAPGLTAMPADLPPAPREAMELANQATFTWTETEAYRHVMDEILMTKEYVEMRYQQGKARGLEEGLERGMEKGRLTEKRDALLRLLARRGVEPTPAQRARIDACADPTALDAWFDRALTASADAGWLDAGA